MHLEPVRRDPKRVERLGQLGRLREAVVEANDAAAAIAAAAVQ